jgi:hypothetical protein
MKRIGAVTLTAALLFSGAAQTGVAHAAPATDLSARRHLRHTHAAYRPIYPSYYGRPSLYAPAPFLPIPPLFGYGWEWW